MLRVTQSISGEGATKYFDAALSTSDYYAREQGLWGGKGAERLGLKGEVNRDDFVALASNQVPGSGEQRLTVRTKDKRTAGYDFCYSVPKSVSICLAHTGDKALERMIHEAFRETMEDVEARMEARVRGKGDQGTELDSNRVTGNMVYASFVHTVTRPVDGIPDPHYHIHGYVFNATFDEIENRWKAGQFMNLKADAPFYEAAFNARLAAKMIEAGYAIRRTDRSFELASVSRELIEKFSRRTRLIEQLAREKYTILEARARALERKTGMAFADAFAQVKGELGAETREKKSDAILRPDEQIAAWRSQMTEQEHASLEVSAVKGQASQNLIDGETARHLSIDHLFERKSVTRALHAAGMFLRRGLGRVTPEQAVEFSRSDERFISLNDGSELVTTRAVLSEEEAMVAIAKDGQEVFEPLGAGEAWKIKDERVAADKGQNDALRFLLASKDLVTSIRGPAGSGKTSLMGEAVAAIEACSGRDVIVLAPSSSAVEVLKAEGFAKSDTLQAFVGDQLLQDVARAQIIWVDEAGFLSVKQMRWLLEYASRSKTRVVLSGDTRQHHGVERGDALRVLEQHGAVHQAGLDTIYRQELQELRDAVKDLADGKTLEGFDKLDAADAVHEIQDKTQRLNAVVDLHKQALDQQKTSLIVAPTHAEARAIAQAVRESMRKNGLLSREEHSFNRLESVDLTESQRHDPINYHVGQRIEFHHKVQGGFHPGEQWEVVSVTSGEVTVKGRAGQVLLPLDQAKRDIVKTCVSGTGASLLK